MEVRVRATTTAYSLSEHALGDTGQVLQLEKVGREVKGKRL